ncbi:MAG: hypothetical protein QOJ98_458, partial [Acidobacteriota bacterium]|nr:hypothetical protein [Acidobacteriota bacterium]
MKRPAANPSWRSPFNGMMGQTQAVVEAGEPGYPTAGVEVGVTSTLKPPTYS